ncbi:uncharacterized protein LOC103789513 [Callithrix jacchus]
MREGRLIPATAAPQPRRVHRAALGSTGAATSGHPHAYGSLQRRGRSQAATSGESGSPDPPAYLARTRGCFSALRPRPAAARSVREAELLRNPAPSRTHPTRRLRPRGYAVWGLIEEVFPPGLTRKGKGSGTRSALGFSSHGTHQRPGQPGGTRVGALPPRLQPPPHSAWSRHQAARRAVTSLGIRRLPPGPRYTRPPVVGGGSGRRRGVGPPGAPQDPGNRRPATPRPCGVQRAALVALGPQPPRRPTLLRVPAAPHEAASCHRRVRQPGFRSLPGQGRGGEGWGTAAARSVHTAELRSETAGCRKRSPGRVPEVLYGKRAGPPPPGARGLT